MNKKKYRIKKIKKTFFRLAIVVISFIACNAYGQSDSQRVIPPPPHAIPQNAGFDVIVKLNGDIVYGLVKKVGPQYISYQRTDIPDGPIYVIPRNEVYVISYRNQVTDYINSDDTTSVTDNGKYYLKKAPQIRHINYKENDLFKNGTAYIQLGFIRSFSKVNDIKSYTSSASFPVISLGYEINYKSNLKLGAQIGFGSHKFSTQQFSSYDSTKNDIALKENIFALYVYGKYYVSKSASRLQPYIKGGLGITSSNIISNNTISFTNDNSQEILVKSGSRSTGIGIIARIGGEYFVSKQLQVYLDAGVGLSVINAGVAFSIE